MPMGLLVVLSIASAVFLAPGLFARWHFRSEREELLVEWLDRGRGSHDDGFEPRGELVLPSGESIENESEYAPHQGRGETAHQALPMSNSGHSPGSLSKTTSHVWIRRTRALSEGVFKPWSDSPLRWILGGGASLALVDLWVRWWTYGL